MSSRRVAMMAAICDHIVTILMGQCWRRHAAGILGAGPSERLWRGQRVGRRSTGGLPRRPAGSRPHIRNIASPATRDDVQRYDVSDGSLTSNRERRLWLWTLVALVAVWSTLGLAQDIAGALVERGLLDNLFMVGLALAAFAIVGPWLKRRPGGPEIWVGLGIAAVYLTMLSRVLSPAERTHLFEYGVVAVLIHQALSERSRNGGRVPAPALIAVAATALLGWLDEGIQSILPNRVYDIVDVGFNALAALLAVTASAALRWTRLRYAGRSQAN